jgi:hypothetical protein
MSNDKEQYLRLGEFSALAPHNVVANFVDQFIKEAWPGSEVHPPTRAYRALEEMLEMNQVLGITEEKAHELVTYVYSRPVGELEQEAGGVAFTAQALMNSLGYDWVVTVQAAVTEAYGRIDKIREKSKSKPKVS